MKRRKNVIAIILGGGQDHDYIHWQSLGLSLQYQ
jgi:hypothetical protein